MRLGVAMPAALSALAGGTVAWYSHTAGVTPNAFGWVLVAALLGVGWRPRIGIWLLVGAWLFIGVQKEWGSRLPAGLSGEDIAVEVTVLTAQPVGSATRLLLSVDKCQSALTTAGQRPSCSALGKVRITAYSDALFEPGEQWQMTLRLRPSSGFANPDTFNYEQWLWREGIHATGYLRQEPAPVRLSPADPTLRQLALDFLARQPLGEQTKRWLAALTLGDSEQLTQDDWSLLNATGTTHLVVISGLHVGLVASFVLMLAKLGARFTTPTHWRMRTWPWWLAALACVGYASLAGMAPPAMRAMVMTLVGLWVLSGRHAPGLGKAGGWHLRWYCYSIRWRCGVLECGYRLSP